ncbi:MAG: hypothetical protein DMG41_01135 [Acidobacteria bacterium]|nr:MAG: hypothetical protein AUH01_06105 [Acidobacteria bacterium 13_2_20CM_56_17]PYT67811.1 MAG: hypothetical protein DMG42_25835 [Acidobacteriota bacterium]PYT91853.1 MAG: hypothetical protein DMG41_01135 [Acidobacteriota bacterium]
MGNAEGSLFGFDSYVQIAACGTYRCRSQPLAPFSDGSRVALHVVGMLLAVVLPVGGARSVLFLLQRITPAKVIRVPHPPVLIGFPLLLAATVQSATGPLPLFEPRMGMKPTTTERTPLPREHTFPPVNLWRRKQNRRERKSKKKKGKAIETELSKKGRKSEA